MKIAKRLVELLARVCVLDREFEAGFRRAGATRTECCSAKIENRQRDFQTFSRRSENIFLRNFYVAHRESPRGGATDSHFWPARFENFKSRHVGRHQECGNRCVTFL